MRCCPAANPPLRDEREKWMKRAIGITCATLVAATWAYGQVVSDRDAKAKASREEQEIAQIEKELVAAVLKADPAGWSRHVDETFVMTLPGGILWDRSRMVASMQSGDLKTESSVNDLMKIRLYGDTAVATYRSTEKSTFKGEDIGGSFRWTDVFVRRGGRWLMVAQHGTRIDP